MMQGNVAVFLGNIFANLYIVTLHVDRKLKKDMTKGISLSKKCHNGEQLYVIQISNVP